MACLCLIEQEGGNKRGRDRENLPISEGKKHLCICSGQPSTWLSTQQHSNEVTFIFNLKTNFSLLQEWLLQKTAPQIHEWVTGSFGNKKLDFAVWCWAASDCNWLKYLVISRDWLSCPVILNQHRNGSIPHFLNQKDRHNAWLNAVSND